MPARVGPNFSLFRSQRSKNAETDWSKDLREPGANPPDSPIERSAGCQPAFLTFRSQVDRNTISGKPIANRKPNLLETP